jgi:osmotically inducible protein OsmC
MTMDALYRTSVSARGGRTGRIQSDDGRLDHALSVPSELGGAGGPGTNPEQLFAAGYAACFESALRLVARKQRVVLDEAAVTADVALVKSAVGMYQLAVTLTGVLPGVPNETAHALMEAAHQVCPYSNATRGNIVVDLHVAREAANG